MEKQLVKVCSWCPDAHEQTASARAHGFDVTHVICAACAKRVDEALREAERRKLDPLDVEGRR